MTPEDAAYHEAGHAVIGWALGCIVRSAIIDANGGHCECEDDPPEAEGKIVLCFAGPAAQRTHGPVETWHGGGDYAKAVEVAQGFGVTEQRVAALIAKTHELVAEHWESIELVAEALSEYGTLQAADIEALLDPTPDRVKLTKQQRQAIVAWAEQVRLVEAVRLFGSRAKGFARRGSDVDLAVTATDGNYTRFDKDWQTALALALALALDMKVRLSQYNVTGDDIVRDYCDTFCVKLLERPAEAGFKRPSSSRGQSR